METTVRIKYIDYRYISKYGAYEYDMEATIAKKYLDRGLIEIIKGSEEVEKEKFIEDIKKEDPLPVVEESPFTLVSWIPAPENIEDIVARGEKYGFKTNKITNDKFSYSSILLSKLLVVDSGIDRMNFASKSYFKTILFQAKKEFIFSVRSSSLIQGDDMFARQLILEAKNIIFLESEFPLWVDRFGDLIQNWEFFVDSSSLWRLVQKTIGSV